MHFQAQLVLLQRLKSLANDLDVSGRIPQDSKLQEIRSLAKDLSSRGVGRRESSEDCSTGDTEK